VKAAVTTQRVAEALSPSRLLGRADAALRQANAQRGVGQAAPVAPGAGAADPADLVARALAILAEENELWQTRRAGTPRGSR
jgi:hypothetical protein